jgi:hypothetical protein
MRSLLDLARAGAESVLIVLAGVALRAVELALLPEEAIN